ncbi:hypothetical protein [Micromonospora carbonacea]|uniref:Uncharacterized protein n=1 Tax=Micromonospora carbonacea TaxID=47853 RepID=A0A1C5AY53_9ACTN|nr:hypothetical protein [Micromonospora carbonacea]SCF50086.1 hypothetical protein GA0070563_12641 [Micromonospora carbonacea]
MTDTETEADVETEIVAGVPVHYHDEYMLSVKNDYEGIYRDTTHDREHVDGMGETPGATTALYPVASARYMAEMTEVLGGVLREPYTLRTTRDVESMVTTLGQHIEALAAVAEGLGVWLDAAHQRGELDGEPAVARAELGKTAELLRGASLPLREVVVPADRSPALDMDALVAGVIEQLRARGVEVTEVRVYESQTVWELGEGRHLSLSREGGWDVAYPVGDGARWNPVGIGLNCWYAHPAQIADLVAQELAERQAAT